MASDSGAKLYDYLKIKFKVESGCTVNCSVPGNTWKEYKRQWVVLCSHLSPTDCFITYCSREDEWLMNQQTLPKIKLQKFQLDRSNSDNSRIRDHLVLSLGHYSLYLQFGSLSKQQQWFDELEKIRSHIYVELIRCREHPEREREYVLEFCVDGIKFWLPQTNTVSFEWKIKSIRRAQYHNNVGKVEIEVGRSTETGEGHFYFIGLTIGEMFQQLKERIEVMSKVASLKRRGNNLPKRQFPSQESIEQMEQSLLKGGTVEPNATSFSNEQEDSSNSTGETGEDEDILPLSPLSNLTFPFENSSPVPRPPLPIPPLPPKHTIECAYDTFDNIQKREESPIMGTISEDINTKTPQKDSKYQSLIMSTRNRQPYEYMNRTSTLPNSEFRFTQNKTLF